MAVPILMEVRDPSGQGPKIQWRAQAGLWVAATDLIPLLEVAEIAEAVAAMEEGSTSEEQGQIEEVGINQWQGKKPKVDSKNLSRRKKWGLI